MIELIETLQQISLGLFVNGSFDIMQGNLNKINIYIVTSATLAMYLFNLVKRRLEKDKKCKDKK